MVWLFQRLKSTLNVPNPQLSLGISTLGPNVITSVFGNMNAVTFALIARVRVFI